MDIKDGATKRTIVSIRGFVIKTFAMSKDERKNRTTTAITRRQTPVRKRQLPTQKTTAYRETRFISNTVKSSKLRNFNGGPKGPL